MNNDLLENDISNTTISNNTFQINKNKNSFHNESKDKKSDDSNLELNDDDENKNNDVFRNKTQELRFEVIKAKESISTDWNIICSMTILIGEIIIVLMIEAVRDDIIFPFIRKREISITEAFSTLCLIFDVIKTALPFALTQGFGFLASKNYSSGNFKRLGRNFNKINFILLVSSIFFIFIFLVVLPPIFDSFIENPNTAANLSSMLRWLSIGLPFSYLKFGSMRYLNSINKGYIATLASISGLLVQIIFLFIFISHLNLVNFGISMSINLGMMTNFFIQYFYILYWKPCSEAEEVPFTQGLFNNMWIFIKYTLTFGGIVYLSMFSFDFMSYLGLILGDNDYTVINFIAILLMIIFMISDAITSASNIMINYCIGLNEYSKVAKIFLYAVLINLFYVVLMLILCTTFYKDIFNYFTNNPALNYIALVEKTSFIILMIFTCYHSVLAETLSAIGGEVISLITTTFSRLILSSIIGIIFVKSYNYGISGILYGMVVGQIITLVINSIYMWLYLKNDSEIFIKNIKEILEKEKKENEELDRIEEAEEAIIREEFETKTKMKSN